jgi:Carboxypeptidase regulatory-like domain
VTGVVKDSSGQGLDNAKVAVSRMGSDLELVTSTDSAGHFQVGSLQFGSYTVRIQVPGFRVYTSQMILRPLQTYNLAATLLVGSVGGAVVVDYAK